MFISKKHLSRRTLLRGAGTAIALPLLDSMIPAHTAPCPDRCQSRTPYGLYLYSPWCHDGVLDT